jgi:catechol 2,3-dioxygenase
VRLQVRDVARSVQWYEATLGLHANGESRAEVTLGTSPDGPSLVVLREEPGTRPVSQRHLGLFHFAILLPNRAALGRFVESLYARQTPMGMADHAVSEAVYLTDPDGLGIEVYADRPRHTWRYEGPELYMTTEPLDVRNVIAAGAGERWAGMPTGTVMGHVHFSVDDLARARAFYHQALGLSQTSWSYPGALFLAAGGYHHHVAANTWMARAPIPRPDDARLLEWELVLPTVEDMRRAADSLRGAGYDARFDERGCMVPDEWGATLRLRHAGP